MQWVRNGFVFSDGEVTRYSTPANSSTTCRNCQVIILIISIYLSFTVTCVRLCIFFMSVLVCFGLFASFPFLLFLSHALFSEHVRLHYWTFYFLCLTFVGYPKELDVTKFGSPAFATNQPTVFALPDLGDLPHSLALGTIGMPGYVCPGFHQTSETTDISELTV